MEFDAVQAAAGAKLLPFLLFCIGFVALFFVYRRSLRQARQRDRSADQRLRSSAGAAHSAINEITEREWLRRHALALKVDRDGQAPQPQVFEALTRISSYQRQRMGG
jgi:hypothetical protein